MCFCPHLWPERRGQIAVCTKLPRLCFDRFPWFETRWLGEHRLWRPSLRGSTTVGLLIVVYITFRILLFELNFIKVCSKGPSRVSSSSSRNTAVTVQGTFTCFRGFPLTRETDGLHRILYPKVSSGCGMVLTVRCQFRGFKYPLIREGNMKLPSVTLSNQTHPWSIICSHSSELGPDMVKNKFGNVKIQRQTTTTESRSQYNNSSSDIPIPLKSSNIKRLDKISLS